MHSSLSNLSNNYVDAEPSKPPGFRQLETELERFEMLVLVDVKQLQALHYSIWGIEAWPVASDLKEQLINTACNVSMNCLELRK